MICKLCGWDLNKHPVGYVWCVNPKCMAFDRPQIIPAATDPEPKAWDEDGDVQIGII
jgi:hypothetical protein